MKNYNEGKFQQVALLLAAGATKGQAAEQAGCDRRTIHRFYARGLMEEVARLRNEMISEACGRFATATSAAATIIIRTAMDEKNPPGVRLRAAELVLDKFLALRNQLEFEGRLSSLEALVKELRGGAAPKNGSDQAA